MPKFTYSASKGIEQSSGSGFYINDVSITPVTTAISIASGVTDTTSAKPYGVNAVTSDSGTTFLTLPVGTATGQTCAVLVVSNSSGAFKVSAATIQGAALGLAANTLAYFVFNATSGLWVQINA
jgi:hypothetical protein